MIASQRSEILRFGVFELDASAEELRKNGVRVKLQQQPFRVLICLLEKSGNVVPREDLIEKLWPNGTVVEYEHSLGTAVNKIRQALDDSADNPRFVETLPRRGYRFLLPVERIARPTEARPQQAAASQTPQPDGTISHYRIIEKIGEGGMGVVFKAEDTKLERPVALKFLAAHTLESGEHKARFLREAKAAARLDHPNVCTIHEIGEVEGQTFLAMAYLEGRTLKDKIRERPLKLSEALDVAIQTAQGLQAAHEKGIVHRDIKSANLMVTPQGQVKIMDFGLAQLADRSKLTRAAALLGTPAYMSPEQAQRQPTDRRTDIWSLGVVIYEMMTGRVPFEGDRETAALHAIIHEEPEPITALRAGVPLQLDSIVGKALAKGPRERYQDVDDLLVDLRRLKKKLGSRESAAPFPGPAPQTTPLPKWKRAARYAGVAVSGVIVGLILWAFVAEPNPVPSELPERRFSFPVSELQPRLGGNGSVEVSPDGRHVAYVAASGLWIRDLSQVEARRLEGTEGARALAWSPDSRSIAFRTEGVIKCVAAQGAPPVTLWEPGPGSSRSNEFVSWSRDGSAVQFGHDGVEYEILAGGGLPSEVPTPPGYFGHGKRFLPALNPGFLYVSGFYPYQREIMLWDSQSEEPLSISKGWAPRYSSSGHLLFSSLSSPSGIWAMPFSAETLDLGKPFPVAPNGSTPSVSNDGTLVYLEHHTADVQLLLLNRDGGTVKKIGQQQMFMQRPDLSPDGRQVAVWGSDHGARFDIWLHEVERPVKRRITRHDGMDIQPVWDPLGTRVAFSSDRTGHRDLYVESIDRNQPAERLLSGSAFAWDWSQDGAYLLISRLGEKARQDLWYLELKNGVQHQAKPLRTTRYTEWHAAFSPDGRYVAFVANDTGQEQVYVCSFPDCDKETPVSMNGGSQARWAKERGTLYYVNVNNAIMEVEVATQPELAVGTPRPLFSHPNLYKENHPARNYDVSGDGQRFVVIQNVQQASARKPALIHVWQNWAAGFKTQEKD